MQKDLIMRYAKLPTGNIADANNKGGNMDSAIKPIDPKSKLVGPAYTVKCHPADNLTIHKAIQEAPEGSVLVVDAGGYRNCGQFGEITALACIESRGHSQEINGGDQCDRRMRRQNGTSWGFHCRRPGRCGCDCRS